MVRIWKWRDLIGRISLQWELSLTVGSTGRYVSNHGTGRCVCEGIKISDWSYLISGKGRGGKDRVEHGIGRSVESLIFDKKVWTLKIMEA